MQAFELPMGKCVPTRTRVSVKQKSYPETKRDRRRASAPSEAPTSPVVPVEIVILKPKTGADYLKEFAVEKGRTTEEMQDMIRMASLPILLNLLTEFVQWLPKDTVAFKKQLLNEVFGI